MSNVSTCAARLAGHEALVITCPLVRPEVSVIQVHGDTLVALAVCCRLARWKHAIEWVVTADPTTADHSAHPTQATLPDSPIVTLPAAWRDLAAKTGQPMAGLLNRAGFELVQAPPVRHVFADHTEITLPTDRAGQIASLSDTFGRADALAWARAIDRADDLWQALRRHGIEQAYDLAHALPAELSSNTTMADVVSEVSDPRLRQLFCAIAWPFTTRNPQRAPALLASRWSVQRMFGRWYLRSATDGAAVGLDRLVDLFRDRAVAWGVRITTTPSTSPLAVIDTRVPVPPRRWWRPRAAEATRGPRVHHRHLSEPSATVSETVYHRDHGPLIEWQWPLAAGGQQLLSHDFGICPADTGEHPAGWTIESLAQWRSRPPIRVAERHWQGSPASHAGPEPWAQLLTGAQIAYEVSEELVGLNIRPTNTAAPTPPRR